MQFTHYAVTKMQQNYKRNRSRYTSSTVAFQSNYFERARGFRLTHHDQNLFQSNN